MSERHAESGSLSPHAERPPRGESGGLVRHFWGAAGVLCVGVGVVGIVMPLLPATPFLLLAAFCFARGSPRLHDWLVNHMHLGPPIRAWQTYRAVSRGAKWAATLALVLAVVAAWWAGVPGWGLAIHGVAMSAAAVFLWTRPEPPQTLDDRSPREQSE